MDSLAPWLRLFDKAAQTAQEGHQLTANYLCHTVEQAVSHFFPRPDDPAIRLTEG